MKNTSLREQLLSRGALLAGFLNAARGGARQRVLRIAECCRVLQGLLLPPNDPVLMPVPDKRGTWWYYPARDKQVRAHMDQLDRWLLRYNFRWQVRRWQQVAKGQPPTVQAEARTLTATRARGAQYGERVPIDETKAVELVLNLAEWAALGRVQRCPACQRWFMAGRTDQQFCGPACSLQYHNRHRDPKDWATYMRKYRKNAKENEIRTRDKVKTGRKGEHYA